ncbi:hypothetical protein DUZ99_09620 [Xylanibacillus composti]|nr:hypothetical protein [Xylanibacillus composti]
MQEEFARIMKMILEMLDEQILTTLHVLLPFQTLVEKLYGKKVVYTISPYIITLIVFSCSQNFPISRSPSTVIQ